MATGLFNLKQVNQAISQGAWSGYIAPRWVEYLVVAGGGGGGAGGGGGGGGGAGGLLTGIVTVAAGTSYTVTVGGGGTAGASANGGDGVASVFGSISATGGGGGGWTARGYSGGSGGGNCANTAGTPAGSGIVGQGNGGGISDGNSIGGGGGGAGTIGVAGVSTQGGAGGAGIASSISGTVIAYSGGGGGGGSGPTPAGAGGVGGGGIGGTSSGVGAAAATNTGGGGGAGGGGNVSGGAGGSGIVVVRYPGNVQFYTGGTVTYSNGYIVHNFTANGTLAPTTPTVVSEYQISRSLRFNGADSTKLTRTPSSSTSGTLGTFSFWTKLGPLVSGSNNGTFISAADSYAYGQFYQNTLYFGNTTNYLNTTAVFRDFSAWYHIVFAFDTTQATSTNRLKIYVNGVLQTAGSLASYPAQNASFPFLNGTQQYQIGGNGFSSSVEYYNGYMTEINFIDGQALPPTSFGYVNPTTGIWSPAKFVGAYGTNGFYLNFSDNSNTTAATLGADYSGNGNNWTPTNFSVTAGAGNDSLVDSPTSYGTDTGVGGEVRGNYSTLSPLFFNGVTTIVPTNGNLDFTFAGAANRSAYSTMGMSSGKWYCEVIYTTVGSSPSVGISLTTNVDTSTFVGYGASQYSYESGYKHNNNSSVLYGATFTNNDVIGIAFDADAGTITFYKNGVSQGVAYSSIPAGTYLFGVTSYQGTGNINFGQRAFAYTAPSGFQALCTQNLPTPTIGATSATLATQYFGVSTYTGNGTSQTITNGGFQPDWVWVKERSAVRTHCLTDSVRGFTKYLFSDSTGAEETYSTLVTSVNSNGFNLGASVAVNDSGQTYVGWQWKANGAGSTNTAGSITSTVSASTTSGFSIVRYSGNATSGATVGHGLGVAPSMVIGKTLNTAGYDWPVYHVGLTDASYVVSLNLANAQSQQTNKWNSTAPTSTVVTLGDHGTNVSGTNNQILYCFAAIAGYSAFGSYTGNASTDGTFVFTGFRPAYVMIKSSSAATDWIVYDAVRNTYNVTNLNLRANTSDAESSQAANYIDLLSNGFKLRGDGSGSTNASGATYIYMAFATSPFKYSLAR